MFGGVEESQPGGGVHGDADGDQNAAHCNGGGQDGYPPLPEGVTGPQSPEQHQNPHEDPQPHGEPGSVTQVYPVSDDLLDSLIGHIRWIAFNGKCDDDADDRSGTKKGTEAFYEALQGDSSSQWRRPFSPPGP